MCLLHISVCKPSVSCGFSLLSHEKSSLLCSFLFSAQPPHPPFRFRKPRSTACGERNTRSLNRSCSTVCATPVPPTSFCSRMATSSRCRATPVTPPHLSSRTPAPTHRISPRLELTEKIEANFYSRDLTPAAPQPQQNEKPAATKISGKEILEAIRLMDADERRELTRALFA